MKKILLTALVLASTTLFAQEKIAKLKYAQSEIKVPENCTAKSEFEIIDCNGFSAQWLFISDDMIKQNIPKIFMSQLEKQFKYESRQRIMFTSQNNSFEGTNYKMNDGSSRIVAFGKVDEISLILNLGFINEPKKNEDLTTFAKNFIIFNANEDLP